MVTENKRVITEEELYFAEAALAEFEETGATDRTCPWCEGGFIFENKGSSYSIECNRCDFKVTSRGF